MFFITACSTVIIERPEIKGTVYDSVSKKAIEKVEISIDNQKIITNSKGEFVIKRKLKREMFNYESGHLPVFYSFTLKHDLYKSFTIKEGTRGSFSEKRVVYDSVFLKPKVLSN